MANTKITTNVIADGAITSAKLDTSGLDFTGDITFDTSTLVIDSTNNRVGIGTSSPAFQNANSGLHIVDATAPGIRLQDSNAVNSDFEIYSPDGVNNLRIAKAGTDFIALDSSGVGIGTTSPTGKLNIVSGSSGSYLINLDYNDNTDGGGFYQSGSTGLSLFLKNSSATQTVQIATSGDSYFNGGDVGIGTSSPDGLLHVSAGNSGDAIVIIQADEDNNAEGDVPQLWFKADGDITEGAVKLDDNQLQLVSNVSSGGGITFWTGTTDNTGTTAPQTGASQRMVIDSSGNVGIGNTTASSFYESHLAVGDGTGDEAITVYSGSSNTGYLLFGDGTSGNARFAGQVRYDHTNNRLEFATNEVSTAKMVIDSSGNVGIGTDSPSTELHIEGSDSVFARFVRTGAGSDLRIGASTAGVGCLIDADDNTLTLRTSTAEAMIFETNNSEAMRIDSSGRWMCGVTSSIDLGQTSVEFDGTTQNGVVYRTTRSATGSTFVKFRNSSNQTIGYIYQDGSTTVNYFTNSDYRLKENVVYDWAGLDRLNQLKPARYNFIGDADVVDGFIAHELQEVMPEVVIGDKDAVKEEDGVEVPDYQGVAISKLVPLLVKSVQELSAKVDTLEAEIEVLRNG